jgi:hypothetical protein
MRKLLTITLAAGLLTVVGSPTWADRDPNESERVFIEQALRAAGYTAWEAGDAPVPPTLLLAGRDPHQRANNGLAAVDQEAVACFAAVVALEDQGHGCRTRFARYPAPECRDVAAYNDKPLREPEAGAGSLTLLAVTHDTSGTRLLSRFHSIEGCR